MEVLPRQVRADLDGTGLMPSSWHTRCRVLHGCYPCALGRGYGERSPLPSLLPTCPLHQSPDIYTTEKRKRLLAATEHWSTPLSPLQAATFRTVIFVLSGTGVRSRAALAWT